MRALAWSFVVGRGGPDQLALLWGRRTEEVLRKKLAVLLAAAMMLAVQGASPAFADPDKNNPSPHSCGVEDSHRYVDEDTKPGASELSQEGFKPLDFGCAPGKEEDPRPK
jgi:hypothetical protein